MWLLHAATSTVSASAPAAANNLLRVMVGFTFEIGYMQRRSRMPSKAACARDSERQE